MRGGKREGAGRPLGAKNRRTAAVEAAMQSVAAKFLAEVPQAFDGDGVAYLQTVYRDPALPVDVRIDAAAKAARYERPALAATLTRDITAPPAAPDTVCDYSRLDVAELVQLRRLFAKALSKPEPEGADEDDARGLQKVYGL
jgi:hypothetical protein